MQYFSNNVKWKDVNSWLNSCKWQKMAFLTESFPSHNWSYHLKLYTSELYQNRGWIMWTVAAACSVYVTFQLVSYFICISSLENQKPEVQHLVWGDARSVQLDFSKIQLQASSFFHAGKIPIPAPPISLSLVLFLACSNGPYPTRHLPALWKEVRRREMTPRKHQKTPNFCAAPKCCNY